MCNCWLMDQNEVLTLVHKVRNNLQLVNVIIATKDLRLILVLFFNNFHLKNNTQIVNSNFFSYTNLTD